MRRSDVHRPQLLRRQRPLHPQYNRLAAGSHRPLRPRRQHSQRSIHLRGGLGRTDPSDSRRYIHSRRGSERPSRSSRGRKRKSLHCRHRQQPDRRIALYFHWIRIANNHSCRGCRLPHGNRGRRHRGALHRIKRQRPCLQAPASERRLRIASEAARRIRRTIRRSRGSSGEHLCRQHLQQHGQQASLDRERLRSGTICQEPLPYFYRGRRLRLVLHRRPLYLRGRQDVHQSCLRHAEPQLL